MKKPTRFSVKKWIVFADTHIEARARTGETPMDRHDPACISILLQIMKDFNPDGVIAAGDIANLSPISPWQRGNGMHGQAPNTSGEFSEGYLEDSMFSCNIFLDLAQAAASKCRDWTVMEGNHEFWLRILRNSPMYKSMRDDLWYPEKNWELKRRGMKYKTYQRYQDFCPDNWASIGKRLVIHGWWVTQNFLNKHFQFLQRPFLMGHVHTTETRAFSNTADGYTYDGHSLACLCTKTASYHRGALNRWSQGFAVVFEFPNGETIVQHVPIVCGRAIFNGKTYTAKRLPESLA